MSEWISVDDRLPEPGKTILFHTNHLLDGVEIGRYEPASNRHPALFVGRCGFLKGLVTHWMPLPEPPA